MAELAPDLADFREELRQFIDQNLPTGIRQRVARYKKPGRDDMAAWQKILNARGWGAPAWPVEWGGANWDVRRRFIFDEVQAEMDCPPQPYQGLRHIGPVIMEFGSDWQKQHFLPRIVTADDFWCQGYSEPNAGSDLASLRTRAVLDGDHYVVNGQKIWTTLAHESNMMFALVRTSIEERKHHGISMLLIPMDTPGLVVRPIRSIDGWHHVNEVFFTDARVPVANRVGEEGKAWSYGKFLLSRERLGSVHILPWGVKLMQSVAALVEQADIDPFARGHFQNRLILAEAELRGLQLMGEAAIDNLANGRSLADAPSAIKLAFGNVTQELTEIGMKCGGQRQAHEFVLPDSGGADPYGANTDPEPEWLAHFLYQRARTIFGGTSEVQKNLIARNLFGS